MAGDVAVQPASVPRPIQVLKQLPSGAPGWGGAARLPSAADRWMLRVYSWRFLMRTADERQDVAGGDDKAHQQSAT